MKKIFLLSMVIFVANLLFAGIPPRDPFVVLRVNGVEYKADAEITVRSGERIKVEAVLMGGKRDYCSNPMTYANVGQNTVILSQGENGMSFEINGNQFTGDWKLVDEKAVFSSGPDVVITPSGSGAMQRTANVEFKPGNYSKVFFKVTSTTNWHYVRNTPAGRTEQDETNTTTATFYFVIEVDEDMWFSSNNIKATGTEDFSVRNNLDRIQEFYDLIEKALLEKNWSSAKMHWGNLKNSIGELQGNIDRAKQKDKNYVCNVTLIGLPSDVSMGHIKDLNTMSGQWTECYKICSDNYTLINEELLTNKLGFTENVLRSIFKNYISWGTSIPTSAPDILTIYDPKNIFTPLDLPRKVMGWYEDAQNDAEILKDQVGNIQYLNSLMNFYKQKMDNSVVEKQALVDIINELKPVEAMHTEMGSYISGLSSVKYIAK
ncbi:MAG TPA: hypothetical protein PKN32_11865 [Bacteroidales bacterium]|nr:hypothetical protein [Bacteroidales bacterium]